MDTVLTLSAGSMISAAGTIAPVASGIREAGRRKLQPLSSRRPAVNTQGGVMRPANANSLAVSWKRRRSGQKRIHRW